MVRGGLFVCEQRIGRHPYSLDDLNFHMTFRNLYRSSVQGKRSRELSSVRHTDCEINNVSGTTAATWNLHITINYRGKFMCVNENANLHHARNDEFYISLR